MRKFIIRFTIFALPFTLYLVLAGGLAIHTGESLTFNEVIQRQLSDHSILFSPYDQSASFAYKVTYLQNYAPEVVIVGSSRVKTYRGAFFNLNPDRAYNACGIGWTMRNILSLTQYMEVSPPRVLILSLDQQWFRSQDSLNNFEPFTVNFSTLDRERRVIGLANVTRAVIDEEIPLSDMLSGNNSRLGLTAVAFDFGYGYDGSHYQPGQDIEEIIARRERDFQAFEAQNGTFYSPANAISTTNLGYLEELLQWAQSHDVEVIGYFPPFMPEIYERMDGNEDYSYIPQSASALDDLFTRYDFHFFDLSDATESGGDTSEMYDGIHFSEVMQMRLHIRLVETLPDILGDYADVDTLETWLEQSDDPFFLNRSEP